MATVIQSDRLMRVLRTAGIAVKPNHPLQILRGALVNIGDATISALASDLAVTVHAQDGAGDPAIAAVVDYGLLSSIVGTLDGEVEIEADETAGKITIRNGAARFDVKVFAPAEYPDPDYALDGSAVQGRVARIEDVYRMVGHAAASDNDGRSLDAVYFDGQNAVATDGFRMAVIPFAFPAEALIPARALRIAAQLVGNDDVDAAIASGRSVKFARDGVAVWSQLYDSKYVDYRAVMNACKNTAVEARIDRDRLALAARRCAVFASAVKIEQSDGGLTLIASGDDGASTERVECEIAGSAEPIYCNAAYLRDALASTGEDEVVLRWSSAAKPLVVEAGELSEIIMPIVMESYVVQEE